MKAEQFVLFPGVPLPAEQRTTVVKDSGGVKRYRSLPNGYARIPGTGPAGETCGSCANCVRVQGGSRAFPKCLVIQFRWTHGPGTDIRCKSPACEMWQAKGGAL